MIADLYRFNYSFFPTNSHFVECGVKESGYVILGWCSEINRSALAMARAKVITDAMAAWTKIVDKGDVKIISTR